VPSRPQHPVLRPVPTCKTGHLTGFIRRLCRPPSLLSLWHPVPICVPNTRQHHAKSPPYRLQHLPPAVQQAKLTFPHPPLFRSTYLLTSSHSSPSYPTYLSRHYRYFLCRCPCKACRACRNTSTWPRRPTSGIPGSTCRPPGRTRTPSCSRRRRGRSRRS